MSQFSYEYLLRLLTENNSEKKCVLITVNARLRDKLAYSYAEYIQDKQLKKTWMKPAIYTLEEKLTELWQAFELNAGTGTLPEALPSLLTKEQERALWLKILQDQYPEGFIQLSKIAALAMQAWRNLHLWAMADYLNEDKVNWPKNEDAKKFIKWSHLFQAELKQNRWITAAERGAYFLDHSDFIRQVFNQNKWILIGFDDFPPIYQRLLKHIDHELIDLKKDDAATHQISFKSSTEEFEAAAIWANALAQKGFKNIGVVHPELATHRNKLEEAFLQAFHPDHVYCAQKMVSNQFSLSAGTPLSSQILVKTALKLLTVIRPKLSISDIDFLLRHGYIGKNAHQQSENLRIIQCLRETQRTVWPIDVLSHWLATHTESVYILELFQNLKSASIHPSDFSNLISLPEFIALIKKQLALFDFPGVRSLSSIEYQITARFYQAIEDFMQLSLILPDKKYADFLTELETYLNFIPFQAESGIVPVNIMGILEASGQLFSHLWIMGMHNENWPSSPDPNPFLPYDLQREKEMPHASAEREYELSTKITQRLRFSAEKVIFSYSLYEEDKPCFSSDCLNTITFMPADFIEQTKSHLPKKMLNFEKIEDNVAPEVEPKEKISGGTRVLKLQAACPFRAFSEIRLQLKPPLKIENQLGISAMERGAIIHDILDKMWAELKNQHNLLAYSQQALENFVQDKIKISITLFRETDKNRLGDKFWENEAINLKKVLINWLNLEKEREPFEVLLRESWQKIQIEGLALNVCVDRIDLTESKESILIDYKTGEMSFSGCFGERLNEPQLPIYCLLEHEHIPLGVAFGLVRPTGECEFIGITLSEKVLPNVKAVTTQSNYLEKLGVECKNKLEANEIWQSLLSYWQNVLSALAKDFMQGVALVSPKQAFQTCQYCHLTSLCRINEKIST